MGDESQNGGREGGCEKNSVPVRDEVPTWCSVFARGGWQVHSLQHFHFKTLVSKTQGR